MTSNRLLLLASLALLAPACGTTAESDTDAGGDQADASTPAPDLASAADMATAPTPDMTLVCSTQLLLGPQWTSLDDTCKGCGTTSCCAELAACDADPACVTLRSCYKGCAGASDSKCLTACLTKLGANAASSALSSCRGSKCGTACADFSCVGKITWPNPAKQSYTLTIRLVDYLSGAAIPNAAVKVCGLADAACANPLSTLMADAKGTLSITAPSAPGTLGAYIETTAAGYPLYLTYITLAPPVSIDGASQDVLLISNNTLGLLSGAAQQQQDMAKGLVIFKAYQCGDFGAPGIAARGDSGTTVYVAGSLPSPAATATDGSGTGALFNVAPGTATITTTLGGKPYGTQKIVVRAGAITSTNLVPTP